MKQTLLVLILLISFLVVFVNIGYNNGLASNAGSQATRNKLSELIEQTRSAPNYLIGARTVLINGQMDIVSETRGEAFGKGGIIKLRDDFLEYQEKPRENRTITKYFPLEGLYHIKLFVEESSDKTTTKIMLTLSFN